MEIVGGQTSFANKLFLIVQMSFFLFLKNFKKKLYLKFSNMNNQFILVTLKLLTKTTPITIRNKPNTACQVKLCLKNT